MVYVSDGKTLFDEFYAQQHKVSGLLRQQKPVEAEDKRMLADLQQRLAANDGAKVLMKAEADFAELMSRVNKSIHDALLPMDGSGTPTAHLVSTSCRPLSRRATGSPSPERGRSTT